MKRMPLSDPQPRAVAVVERAGRVLIIKRAEDAALRELWEGERGKLR